MQSDNITRINIDLLIPNSNQPRKKFDENSLKELALSIKEYGILNPILVRKKDNLYEIIAGERRYRAAKLLELSEVPVIIRDDITEEKIPEIALIENLQRENITAIEEAKSYQEILSKSNLTEEKLSEMIGKSQSFISNKLRLLNLPDNIQDALINKKISERHARSLLKVKDINKQNELLERIIKEKLTVKELDNIIEEKQITEEEINNAISDIMKSLKINEEKEEKESDNMNNGSFFPNYNYGPEAANNMSLNNMNMQTMNMNSTPVVDTPTAPVNTNPVASEAPIFPTANNGINLGEINPIMNNEPTVAPTINESVANTTVNNQEAPLFPSESTPNVEDSFVVKPTPNNEVNNILPGTTPQDVTPIGTGFGPQVDIPLFNTPDFNIEPTPQVEPVLNSEPSPSVLPQQNNEILPAQETPLFNPSTNISNSEMVIPSSSVNTQNIELPVNDTAAPVNTNKLTQVEDFLKNNAISYKKYSNETGHCIIIEL